MDVLIQRSQTLFSIEQKNKKIRFFHSPMNLIHHPLIHSLIPLRNNPSRIQYEKFLSTIFTGLDIPIPCNARLILDNG